MPIWNQDEEEVYEALEGGEDDYAFELVFYNEHLNPLATNDIHMTLFTYAVMKNVEPVVRVWLERGVRPNNPAIARSVQGAACANADVELFTLLLDHGMPIETFVVGDESLLHHCVRHARDTLITVLLERGADVNSVMRGGETPLHMAVGTPKRRDSAIPTIDLLLNAGASLDAVDHEGRRPVDRAATDEIRNRLMDHEKSLLSNALGKTSDLAIDHGSKPRARL